MRRLGNSETAHFFFETIVKKRVLRRESLSSFLPITFKSILFLQFKVKKLSKKLFIFIQFQINYYYFCRIQRQLHFNGFKFIL